MTHTSQLALELTLASPKHLSLIQNHIQMFPFCSAVEAFTIGTRLGDKIIFLACSTGATLVTWVMAQKWAKPYLQAAVMVSPAYGINLPGYHIFKHMFHCMPVCAVARILKMIKGTEHHKANVLYEVQTTIQTCEYPFECLPVLFELYYEVGSTTASIRNLRYYSGTQFFFCSIKFD